MTIRATSQTPWVCGICEQGFTSWPGARHHAANAHRPENARPSNRTCTCGQTMASVSGLWTHIQAAIRRGDRSHQPVTKPEYRY